MKRQIVKVIMAVMLIGCMAPASANVKNESKNITIIYEETTKYIGKEDISDNTITDETGSKEDTSSGYVKPSDTGDIGNIILNIGLMIVGLGLLVALVAVILNWERRDDSNEKK